MTFTGFQQLEELATTGFALQLFDGFTGESQLQGSVSVTITGQPEPVEKTDSSTFVFLNIGPGTYAITVQPDTFTPYYLPVTISVTLPMPDPRWQAYPDVSLADKSLGFDDPGQTAAYRIQRTTATLVPTPAYPFPPGATLLRGTVLAGAAPLAGATVERVSSGGGGGTSSANVGTTSDANGQFVMFFNDVSGLGQTATIRASHPLRPNPVEVQVTLQRGVTVSTQIVM